MEFDYVFMITTQKSKLLSFQSFIDETIFSSISLNMFGIQSYFFGKVIEAMKY